MKSQRRLRLRLPGRHFGEPRWTRQFMIGSRLALAFEMQCHPRHLREDEWSADMVRYEWCRECGAQGGMHTSWCEHNTWKLLEFVS